MHDPLTNILSHFGKQGIQETVDDLQAEIASSQEVQEAIYKGLSSMPPLNDSTMYAEGSQEDEETLLVRELEEFLQEGAGEEGVGIAGRASEGPSELQSSSTFHRRHQSVEELISSMPEVPSSAATSSATRGVAYGGFGAMSVPG